MSARSRALVPLSTEQQAAWRAVAETEKRRHQGNTLAEYPYAGAFFRCLNGSRRISLSDLRFFMPSLTAEELHGNRLQWLPPSPSRRCSRTLVPVGAVSCQGTQSP